MVDDMAALCWVFQAPPEHISRSMQGALMLLHLGTVKINTLAFTCQPCDKYHTSPTYSRFRAIFLICYRATSIHRLIPIQLICVRPDLAIYGIRTGLY